MKRERRRNEKDSIHKTRENVADGWRNKKKNKRKKTNKSKDFGTNEDLKSPDIEGRTEKKIDHVSNYLSNHLSVRFSVCLLALFINSSSFLFIFFSFHFFTFATIFIHFFGHLISPSASQLDKRTGQRFSRISRQNTMENLPLSDISHIRSYLCPSKGRLKMYLCMVGLRVFAQRMDGVHCHSIDKESLAEGLLNKTAS